MFERYDMCDEHLEAPDRHRAGAHAGQPYLRYSLASGVSESPERLLSKLLHEEPIPTLCVHYTSCTLRIPCASLAVVRRSRRPSVAFMLALGKTVQTSVSATADMRACEQASAPHAYTGIYARSAAPALAGTPREPSAG